MVDQSEQKKAWEKLTVIKEKDKELRMKAARLRRQLAELEKELKQVSMISAVN